MAKLEEEIDRLFELPLEEFTAARNELSRRLKSEGEGKAADNVKRLGKPNTAAWAINQLARRQKNEVQALLDAGARLRAAQERALQGGGNSADDLRRAQTDERQAIRDLTQQAQQVLQDSGHRASTSLLDRISSSLRAAAISEAGREAVRTGRLTGEVKPSGFDAVSGLELPTGSRARVRARDELAERRREKDRREQRRRQLKETARDLAGRAKKDELAAERAERAAADARRAADKSRRQAEEAAAKLEALD